MHSVLSSEFQRSALEELGRLQKHRAEIVGDLDTKIEALQQLVGNLSAPPTGMPAPPGYKVVTKAASEPFSISVAGDSRPLGLTAAIERVMAANPNGLRPFQVSERLIGGGFSVSGTIKLQDRVAGEMARLKRTKKLVRDEDGTYKLNLRN